VTIPKFRIAVDINNLGVDGGREPVKPAASEGDDPAGGVPPVSRKIGRSRTRSSPEMRRESFARLSNNARLALPRFQDAWDSVECDVQMRLSQVTNRVNQRLNLEGRRQ
jgi:hypothetical protein